MIDHAIRCRKHQVKVGGGFTMERVIPPEADGALIKVDYMPMYKNFTY